MLFCGANLAIFSEIYSVESYFTTNFLVVTPVEVTIRTK